MKIKKIISYGTVIAVVVVLVLIKVISDSKAEDAKSSGGGAAPIVADIYIAKDTSACFKLSVPGTIRAVEKTDIIGELKAKITEVNFKQGSFVKRGDVLFKLDDSDISAELKQKKANEKLALQTENRLKSMYESGGTSLQELDEARANLESIQAEIAYIKTLLDKTEVKAPFSGITGLRNVSVGSVCSPSLVLTTIYDISYVYIDFQIPERYASSDFISKEIEFSMQGSAETYKGIITAIEPEIDLKTRTLPLRAKTDNKKMIFKPGASVKVFLSVDDFAESIFIPSNALLPTLKGYSVYILKNGAASKIDIETGIRNESSVQVVSGIERGDSVITTNLLRIKQDAFVKPGRVN